jgi:uncharacterized surface protein with fasciclin (FAS1) repeats
MKSTLMILTVTALIISAAPQVQARGDLGTEARAAAGPDIVETAVAAGDFETLVAALKAAELVDALQGEGPFTVFAPTDEAFGQLPAGLVENLLKPENRQQLVSILTYHVVSGDLSAKQVVQQDKAETLNGQSVAIDLSGKGITVDEARVIATDIEAANGVIHVIDRVLLPAEEMSWKASSSELIEMAIAKGAPMYNHGNPAACAAVYAMTAKALLALDADLPQDAHQALSSALMKMDQSNSSRDQAWIMRRGLDRAYEAMAVDVAGR